MADLYLVCGISGGGKSKLSHRILSRNPQISHFFDVDEYYAKYNGDECDRRNSYEVWRLMLDDIRECELKNETVLITVNALTVTDRYDIVSWYRSYNKHLLWVISPWERCVEGNLSRRRHVPLGALQTQWTKMEFPNAHEEGWDTITHVTNCWDNENYILFKLKGDISEKIKF